MDYLINDLHFDIEYKTKQGSNAFLVSFSNNNINILKYFINELKMDIAAYKNNNGTNGFLYACGFNTNLDIIKYLIEELYTNTIHKNNICNVILKDFIVNRNLKIIKYFIENVKINITTCLNMDNESFKELIKNEQIYYLINTKYIVYVT